MPDQQTTKSDMSTIVSVYVLDPGNPLGRDDYPTATTWTIDEVGVLRILGEGRKGVAAYAPGHWVRIAKRAVDGATGEQAKALLNIAAHEAMQRGHTERAERFVVAFTDHQHGECQATGECTAERDARKALAEYGIEAPRA